MGRSHLFAGVLSVFFCAFALFGQGTAQLGGSVTDPSGAVIPGANVTVTNADTGVKWETTTTAEGYYAVPALPPGAYSVTVRQDGFRTVTRSGLVLETGFKRTVDIQLAVGSVTEKVDVTAQTPLIETEDSSVGQFIERTTVLNMPLADRRAGQLARLGGAVVGSGTSFSLAGGRGENQNWLLDGTTVQGATLNNPRIIYDPPAESVREFKVEMNNYSAEYGRSAGGQILMTTRSGTNQFHGALYEFFRNQLLDTRTFFEDSKGPLRYNVFGGSLGGPIRKNRTFFFFNYEGSRRRDIATSSAVVPHPPELTGDFSNRVDLNLIGPLTRTQFPNNIIPQARMDPVGLKVAKVYPAPNYGTMDIRRIEKTNYMVTQSTPLATDFYTAKADHDFSVSDKVFVRVLREASGQVEQPLLPLDSGAKGDTRNLNVTAGWVHLFTPTVLSQLRYNRGSSTEDGVALQNILTDAELGVKGTNPGSNSGFAPTGFTGFGGSNPAHQVNITQELLENLSWAHGHHQLKTGFNYRYGGSPNKQVKTTRFSFSNRVTGSGLAELLLGRVSGAKSKGIWDLHGRMDNYATFIQDDWKVRSNLTLNIGLRWELETPRWDARNQQSGLDLTAINPVCKCPGVVTFAGVDGRSKYASDFDWNNFGPRFGFAWRAPLGLVVRGGYGLHYNPLYHSGVGGWDLSTAFVRQVSFSSPDGGRTPVFLLKDGLPPIPEQPHTAAFGSVAPGQNPYFSPSFTQQDHVNGYAHQWNFGIQKQMFADTVLELAYLGNAAHKLGGEALNINMIPLVNGRGPATADRRLLRFPQFNQVTHQFPPWGDSNYHAMNLKAEKRYSHGLNFLVNYTWSKMIDDVISKADLGESAGAGYTHVELRRFDRSLSGTDIRHRFMGSGVWELPFGQDRHWRVGNRVLRQIVGGWGVGLIAELRTGMPFSVAEETDTTNTFSMSQRPNLLRDPRLPADRPLADKLAQWFDISAFEEPGEGIFGNAPRLEPGGPGMVQIDVSVHKAWNLGERYRFLFRSDFYNLPNHPNFADPDGRHGGGNFGQISSILGNSTGRQIQLSLRLEF